MKTNKKKCRAACSCGGAKDKVKGGKEERTSTLKIRMTPSVKDRTVKLIDDICVLKEDKLSCSDIWEYLFLPTLEALVKESNEERERDKKAEAKAKKASGKNVSVKKTVKNK